MQLVGKTSEQPVLVCTFAPLRVLHLCVTPVSFVPLIGIVFTPVPFADQVCTSFLLGCLSVLF